LKSDLWDSKRRHAPVLAVIALSSIAAPAAAQGTPAPIAPRQAPPPDDDDSQAIVVNGVRPPLPGAVVGDIPPELQYGPADIRAYGVSSVSDLLNELAPEIRSDRGRGGEAPVVLLNGRRISSLTEIRDIPTEAILRVDILPEEVALKYGYTADQKVVNIVLRRRFRAITGEGDGLTTTDGGAESGTGDLDLLRIRGDDRLNFDIKATDTAKLRESQRDIDSPATNHPDDPITDLAPYRTIAPSAKTVGLNSVLAHPFGKRVNATLNGTFDYSDSGSLNGLPSANLLVPADDPFNTTGNDATVARYLGTDPLRQDVRTLSAHLGTTVNADIAKWRLSFTAGYDHSDTRTRTDTRLDDSALQAALDAGDPSVDPYGTLPASLIGGRVLSSARALSDAGNVQFLANGPLFDLPAGPFSTSLKVGYTDSGFDTTSDRSGSEQRTSLSRSDASAQVNLDLPIASRTHHFLPFLGTLSANTNIAVDHYNDFGTETTLGYGLNWTPRDGITLIASTTRDHGIPTVQQLAGPAVVTPAVPVFDYLTGKTVDVSETAGGNPDLRADTRRVDKLGLTIKPVQAIDLTLSANYIRSTIRNAIAAFPSPTAAIELAFPDRFERDSDGDLESIDDRPINFARERRQELRWGVNFTQKLKTPQAVIDAYRALRASGAFQRPGGFGGFGGGGPGGGGAGGGGAGSGAPDGGASGGVGTPGATASGGSGGSGAGGPGGGYGGGRGGGGGGFGGGGGGGFGGRGSQGGRLQISLYHTWYFRDDILVQPGGPTLDLLNGGATGTGGGQPRHQVDLQIGLTQSGIGARMTGSWQSATTVTAGTDTAATSNLHFSSLAVANFRLFADLGQLPGLIRHRWARGMRVTLAVNNILDTRQRVRDGTGATPLAYQPDYLDPLGRTVRISLRKLFF